MAYWPARAATSQRRHKGPQFHDRGPATGLSNEFQNNFFFGLLTFKYKHLEIKGEFPLAMHKVDRSLLFISPGTISSHTRLLVLWLGHYSKVTRT